MRVGNVMVGRTPIKPEMHHVGEISPSNPNTRAQTKKNMNTHIKDLLDFFDKNNVAVVSTEWGWEGEEEVSELEIDKERTKKFEGLITLVRICLEEQNG